MGQSLLFHSLRQQFPFELPDVVEGSVDQTDVAEAGLGGERHIGAVVGTDSAPREHGEEGGELGVEVLGTGREHRA